MRTSILSRSAIAVASLAIGSVALAAVPATAATSTGITRDEVLAAAAGLRADGVSSGIETTSPATQAALEKLAVKGCGAAALDDGFVYGTPVETPDSVDGLVVTTIQRTDRETPLREYPIDSCSFVAIAPIDGATTLSGDVTVESRIFIATLGVTTTDRTYAASGDVFASPGLATQNGYDFSGFTAAGLVENPGSPRVLTTTKIADKKTKAEKKAAKKTYERRIKAAKKTYAKALKKARGSSAKKQAARIAYGSRRSSAKSAYAYAIADYKLVKIRSSKADARRFSVSAQFFPLG